MWLGLTTHLKKSLGITVAKIVENRRAASSQFAAIGANFKHKPSACFVRYT